MYSRLSVHNAAVCSSRSSRPEADGGTQRPVDNSEALNAGYS